MTQAAWPTVAFVVLSACGSKEAPSDPEISRRLAECQSTLARAETATEMCTKQLDDKSAAGGQWVLSIEGDTVKIGARSRPGSAEPTLSSEEATRLTAQFNGEVRRSRGAIQQCYVAALKKNESIQARTIELTVNVLVGTNGQILEPAFSPRISSDFAKCMGQVAKRWKLDKVSGGGIRLQYPVTLTPT